MALHHAASGELIDIRPFRERIGEEITRALYKSHRLEVFRKILLAGETMPDHRVDGEITVQCLEGSLEFALADKAILMREGDLVCVAGGEPHALTAVEDCSFLVTILLHVS